MKLKKLLTIGLACALLMGGVLGVNAAELDTAWYAAKNPDVVAVFGNTPEMLMAHYQMFGRMEGRLANEKDMEGQLRRLFQAEEYAALYPDIKAAFGDNKEAMFQHYLAFGLLESRRPSEKVSGTAAASLKKAVEKAMADAGIAVAPGSPQLVEIITGAVAADAGGAAVQAALAKAAPAVEQAISGTVKEVNNPSSSSSGGGSSSSGSSSSSSSSSGSSGGSASEPSTPAIPEHVHDFSKGNCACGVAKPAEHTHDFGTDGTTDCACGEKAPAEHKHVYDQAEDKCVCGADKPADGQQETPHKHNFGENGTTDCACGVKAPAAHTHDFGTNGTEDCVCGEKAPAKHTHSFAKGTCKCGQTITAEQCPDKAEHGDLKIDEKCEKCDVAGTKKYEASACAKKSDHKKGQACDYCNYDQKVTEGHDTSVASHSKNDFQDGVCKNCEVTLTQFQAKCNDHVTLHVGKTCDTCGASGTVAHTWAANGDGTCTVDGCDAMHTERHDQISTDETCEVCGGQGTMKETTP